MTSIVATGARHRAAAPGTFSRSMLAAATRGLGLVVAAVVVGIVLLRLTDNTAAPPPSAVVGAGTTTTTTTTTPEGPGTLRPPAEVTVLVLNGARVAGVATEVTEQLQGVGHPTLSASNAPPEEQTIVYFKPGFELEAEAVAIEVGDFAHTEPLQDPSPFAGTEQADLVVVLGADYVREG